MPDWEAVEKELRGIDYAEGLPTEGAEAFIDDTNYPIFGAGEKAAG